MKRGKKKSPIKKFLKHRNLSPLEDSEELSSHARLRVSKTAGFNRPFFIMKSGGKKSPHPLSDKLLWCVLLMAALTVYSEKILMSYDLGVDYILISQDSLSKLIAQDVPDQPPFYFILLKAWISLFGESVISLRTMLFLSLAGLIVLTYHIALKLFESRFAALLASLLVSQNPTVIWFTFDPKYWMVFTFLAYLSVYLFLRYPEKPSFSRQMLWGLSAGILPATCLVGFGIVLAFCVYLLILVVFKHIRFEKIVAPICIILLLSTSVIYKINHSKNYLTSTQASKEDAKEKGPYEFFKGAFRGLFLFFAPNLSPEHILFVWFILVTALLGVLAALRDKNRLSLFCILWLMILLAGGYYSAKQTIVRDRYFLPIVPLIFMLSASFLARIRPRILLMAFTVYIIASSSVFFYSFYLGFRFPDWKMGAELALDLNRPGDTIIIVKDLFKRAVQEVFLKRSVTEYDKLEEVRFPAAGDVILVQEGDAVNWLDGLRTEFFINRSYALDGVGVHKLSRKEQWNELLSKEFSQAKIRVLADEGWINCAAPESKGVCFREDWQNVRVVNTAIDGFSRECIFAHPRGGQVLELNFPQTVLDASLVVYAGIEDAFVTESGKFSQSYIEVYRGKELLDTLIVPSKRGYFRYVIDTSRYAGEQGLVLRISTDYDVKRHLCFNAATSSQSAGLPNDFFYRSIGQAKVYVTNNTETTSCSLWQNDSTYPHHEQEPPFNEGKMFLRWDCEPNLLEKGKLWATYAQGFDASAGVFRKALWAHPHDDNTLRIEYADVPLNGSLNGFYGINDLAFSNMPQNKLTFTIRVDGRQVYSSTFEKRMGWMEFSLTDGIPTAPGTVSFEVRADTNKWAHFFFNAFI